MATRNRLPSRFPAGTKFVVEGEDAAGGGTRIVARYLVYPDGKRVDLLDGGARVFECCTRKARGAVAPRAPARASTELAYQ